MKLSIIIVSWNVNDLLQKCLYSIYFNSPREPFEVTVVDNASSDGSAEMVQDYFPQVKLIKNNTNVGFARGNNQAIIKSAARYVLLLNPDTEVKPGALNILLDFMDRNHQAGAAGPRLLNSNGTLQVSCYPAPTLSRELWRLFHLDKICTYGIYDVNKWSLENPHPVDVLQGACLILRREVIDRIGLLDEDYFMYTEEVDICYRIKKAGSELYWVPSAKVVHHGGQSSKIVATEMFINLYLSKMQYFRKNYGRVASQIYKLILIAAVSSRLALTPMLFFVSPSRRGQRLDLAKNYSKLLQRLVGIRSI